MVGMIREVQYVDVTDEMLEDLYEDELTQVLEVTKQKNKLFSVLVLEEEEERQEMSQELADAIPYSFEDDEYQDISYHP
jgi:hypothetical protein